MSKLLVSACFTAFVFAVPASAYSTADQSNTPSVTKQTEGKALLLARKGADDRRGDDRGGKGKDDGANHASNETGPTLLLLARNGADDRKGDDRGGKGKDDGANHASNETGPTLLLLARNGADD